MMSFKDIFPRSLLYKEPKKEELYKIIKKTRD